jgi:hypothetical protein
VDKPVNYAHYWISLPVALAWCSGCFYGIAAWVDMVAEHGFKAVMMSLPLTLVFVAFTVASTVVIGAYPEWSA